MSVMRENPAVPSSLEGEQRGFEGPRGSRGYRRPQLSVASQVAIGIAAALAAVAIRYALPLTPLQLPVLTVVVAVALTTTLVGLASGIATASVGGLMSWYIFFSPFSWELTRESAIPLIGFSVTASVIIATAHLHRLSEERWHEAQLAAVEKDAETAKLFARELAHRLKNTLAVVQSIAFRTFGNRSPESQRFSGRLRALSEVHDLLSEHIDQPSARVSDLVKTALLPFDDSQGQVSFECSETTVNASNAVNLALAVHELSTNALKYGALSVPEGSVKLKVEEAGEYISFHWEEEGGPHVEPPETHGFGMKLLNSLGSNTQIAFEPGGLRCSLMLPKA
jgi:two-component sensor histidine kinase